MKRERGKIKKRAKKKKNDGVLVEMRLVGDCTYGEGGGQGKVVVVGVKFDGESRELLTWALVKVAQPGDCIIALHVLDTITGKHYGFKV